MTMGEGFRGSMESGPGDGGERGGEVRSGPAGSVDLTAVCVALSDALDLVGMGNLQHGKRVAWFATEIGRAIGFEPSRIDDLFLGALLHDCGVSTTTVHRRLVENFAWEDAPTHCRVGHDLLSGFAPFRRLAALVLLHHTRWEDPLLDSQDDEIALLSNTIFLADRIDALGFRRRGGDLLLARSDIRLTIEGLRGSFFEHQLVEAFQFVSEPEAFWLMTEPLHLSRWLEERIREARPRPAGRVELRQLAGIFARIVDAKSRFTGEHSQGVARLARHLAGRAGLEEETCEKVELAGLLHDLGKLRVPDEILDKPGRLDPVEFAEMERHTFETWQILRRIEALSEIAGWAAWHHERISGNGYPFHRRAGEIPLPARIVAVSDVVQALAQDRPYRGGLPPAAIGAILCEMAGSGHLDPSVVGLVHEELEGCWALAKGGASTI
jgi:HD-GYP domain-containing protein (c-di-GMP phosphodiesterase class II)